MVELLAAVPSVVLGLWAIFVMEPFIRPGLEMLYTYFGWFPLFSSPPMGPGTLPAVLILVVMILPIITAISRDSLQQVPKRLTQAAYGIGTTRWGAIINVTLPAAISGIVGGVMLALGRAMGETMAVTMIIGNSNNFSFSLLAPGNTISAMLANQFGEADGSQGLVIDVCGLRSNDHDVGRQHFGAASRQTTQPQILTMNSQQSWSYHKKRSTQLQTKYQAESWQPIDDRTSSIVFNRCCSAISSCLGLRITQGCLENQHQPLYRTATAPWARRRWNRECNHWNIFGYFHCSIICNSSRRWRRNLFGRIFKV
jgi:hypothetical protein